MRSFRDVNDDLLKDWIEVRKEDLCCNLSEEDRMHRIEFDEICEQILRSIPKKNRRFVEKKLELLEDNWMDYLFYWNEKFYRCGFCDGGQLVMECIEN